MHEAVTTNSASLRDVCDGNKKKRQKNSIVVTKAENRSVYRSFSGLEVKDALAAAKLAMARISGLLCFCEGLGPSNRT
jgi:hypothetical protein